MATTAPMSGHAAETTEREQASARAFALLPPELLGRIKDYDVRLYDGVHPAAWNEADTYLDYIGENRIAHEGIGVVSAFLERAGRAAGESIDLLDIGSGLGGTLRAASCDPRLRLHGVEPDAEALALSRDIFAALGIQARIESGVGEELPFAEESFDVVTNLTILEHVDDPRKVLREAMRVLRPGGILYTFVPNYRFPWEGHYRMVWPPMFPKVLASEYLRLRGRDPRFLGHIKYITPHLVLRTLESTGATAIHDLSGQRMRRKLENPATLTTPGSRRFVERLLSLPILGSVLLGLPGRMQEWGLAYPIVVVAIK